MTLKAIGIIRSPFAQAQGTPIQPCFAAGAEGVVEVFEEYREGLCDLDGFDRIWLVYWFHRARGATLIVRPYLDDAQHGVFATRAPARPNRIGISSVRLLAVEGDRLRVGDLDILDGTPLLDIKPHVPRFDHYPVTRCGWMDKDAVKTRRDGQADERFERTEGDAP